MEGLHSHCRAQRQGEIWRGWAVFSGSQGIGSVESPRSLSLCEQCFFKMYRIQCSDLALDIENEIANMILSTYASLVCVCARVCASVYVCVCVHLHMYVSTQVQGDPRTTVGVVPP